MNTVSRCSQPIYLSPFNLSSRLGKNYPSLIRSFSNQSAKLWGIEMDGHHLLTLQNNKFVKMPIQEILATCKNYKYVHIDIGTGDGKFVYRQALKTNDTYFIGIDSNPSLMGRISKKIARKPSRGGLNNISFIACAAEDIPPNFRSVADRVTINYPWAKLLQDIVVPNPKTLSCIAELAKPKGRLDIMVNYTVFSSDPAYLRKMNLPKVDKNYIEQHLIQIYKASAIKIHRYVIQPLLVDSHWGKQLAHGSNRETLHLQCTIDKK
ncbi:methyltransferase domain-containing protein [Candidatus Protochlamydia sp. W-9]|uniref:methyltransferase domain-containing protein n=1 Tax=Candidatus Protochlamydia sp. W-9 TaxID=1785087 RepID=UPI00096A293B|nr:methyltransferase domain-containing protein [Candidatus Protochlamydia sp. W-9]